mmetsp:Transcript_17404/g.49396  ORF Transcript_17404/g.49396 Transcript_17404/m.49396 type:complete len:340 (+) Transcript_17404:99-1118(+)
MKVFFLYDAFNSMSQSAYLHVTAIGHKVVRTEYVSLRHTLDLLAAEQKTGRPVDVMLCPFLTKIVPEELYNHPHIPCLIVHPGVVGDRGASSIDWALMRGELEWGVTVMQAAEEVDVGDVYATTTVSLRRPHAFSPPLTKSSVYRREVNQAAMAAITEALTMVENGVAPMPLECLAHKGTFLPCMRQKERKIDWSMEAAEVVRRCNASETQPGVLEVFNGESYLLYGFSTECLMDLSQCALPPKSLIGHREGAVLVKCGGNTAMWVSQAKRLNTKESRFFKAPPVNVLSKHITGSLPELTLDSPPSGCRWAACPRQSRTSGPGNIGGCVIFGSTSTTVP